MVPLRTADREQEAAPRRGPAPTRGTAQQMDVTSRPGTVDLRALQSSAGNAAVGRVIAAQRALEPGHPTGIVVQRGRKNRRNRGGGKGGKSTAVMVRPSTALIVKPQPITIPITEKTIKKTPEVMKEGEQQGDVGEVVGQITGGVLDIWEGLETATDSNKDTITRGGGVSKAVGGGSALTGTVGKSLDLISESTGDMAGTVTEACGFITSAAECLAAVREGYQKGTTDTLLALGRTIGPLLTGALKTFEAYSKWADSSETFKKWIAENRIPQLSMVSSAVKILSTVKEMWGLSDQRHKLNTKLRQYSDQSIIANTRHLISLLDSKWYKGAVEILGSMAEFTGEALKWGGFVTGWLAGSVVGAGSKLIPLGVKVFNYLWQTANDWGGTTLWGGKTTAQLTSDTNTLATMIKDRHQTAFGKMLCEAIGLPHSEAGDRDKVLNALAAFA